METSLEKNKQIIKEFYEALINKKDWKGVEKYLGEEYIQHNPTVADGIKGLKEFFDWRNKEFPESYLVLKRIFAEGDYVICHVHSLRVPGEAEYAAIDIFRLDDGKVCEHWDAFQEIPETSAHQNTMF